MKGKEIVGVGMLFCRGWREIRGEMRKKMKKNGYWGQTQCALRACATILF
jgi:hypothetical protein